METQPTAKREFQVLRDLVDAAEARRRKTIEDASKAASALAEAREKTKSPSSALKEVSDNLVALGREQSVWERINASAHFVRDVSKRVTENGEAAQKAADASTAAAKEASGKPDAAKFGAEASGSAPKK